MPITLRHDAAGVVPPSNNATRKYGQQLVMQQQQQKYAAQQAGFDRLFQLGRDQMQNQADFVKDVRQSVIQDRRDQAQNDFQTARDKTLFDQQQQQQEMARQQKFMDDARKQSSGIIMQDIQNGEYDPATARKLQQNLIAESEALGNPQYDATQRAEALEKIRAERTLLTTNRLQKPPPPTPQEQFDKSIVTGPDGTQYRQNAKGEFEPLPKQAKPPTTSAEAFAADPKLRDQYMADARAIKVGDNPLTPENRQEAAALAHKLWEQDNTPTAVPELPGSAPAQPGESRSILEDTASMPDRGMPPSPAVPPGGQLPAAPAPAPTLPGAGSSLPLTSDSSSASVAGASGPTASSAPSVNTPSGNRWAAADAGGAAPTPSPGAQQSPQVTTPDFGGIIKGSKDKEDRALATALWGIYSKQTPEAQNAIGVILNQGSTLEEVKAANDYLKSVGIDIDQLIAPKPPGGGRKGKSK